MKLVKNHIKSISPDIYPLVNMDVYYNVEEYVMDYVLDELDYLFDFWRHMTMAFFLIENEASAELTKKTEELLERYK